MVKRGFAVSYLRSKSHFKDLEDEARAKKIGIWKMQFDLPQDWRRGRTTKFETDSAGTAEAKCAIKGNISKTGKRIFHSPGDRGYANTKIDPSTGERWFCSAEEAMAAGWRRAQN